MKYSENYIKLILKIKIKFIRIIGVILMNHSEFEVPYFFIALIQLNYKLLLNLIKAKESINPNHIKNIIYY